MTLQSSRPISIGNIATELGIGLPLSLGDSRVRALAGKPSGPISIGDCLGKTRFVMKAASDGSTGVGFATFFTGSTFSPSNFLGHQVVEIDVTPSGILLAISGNLPQNLFSSLNVQTVGILNSASATAYTPGAITQWWWAFAPTQLVAGNFYDAYFN